jgi:hypothetical protein
MFRVELRTFCPPIATCKFVKDSGDDDILAAATNLNDIRRSLMRETVDFVAKFKDGFEAGFVAADLLKKIREGREDL